MSNFKSLNIKKYQKTGSIITPDTLYWKKLSVPTLVKEFGAIDYIDFSPVEPHYFAVTCSVRVQIYNPITKLVAKNISRFQQTAYGGTFRQDGRLLVAGDEEGFVKLFDTSSKSILRFFRGHKSAVHRTMFLSDMHRISSFSDDKTVKIWDIATENTIHTFEEHTDYIRAGCVHPTSPNLLFSGGYDNLIKMYDTRTNGTTFTIDHGSPVESIICLPTGGIFLSAGGTEIRVWDILAGGKLLLKLSQHHKTVTCLRLASNGKRILSGGLDRHIKIYDVATYKTVHNIDFPNSVLSIGVAPNDQTLVAGMVDGLISIQNMEEKKIEEQITETRSVRTIPNVDHIVEDYAQKTEAKYDHWFRKYEYSKALDEGLKPYNINKRPHITVSIFQELIHRKGLHRALAGRTHTSLAIIIRFIKNHIGENRFMRVLTNVANALLDVYEDQFDQFTGYIGKLFVQLAESIKDEVQLTYDLLEFEGALEMILEASNVATDNDECFYFTEDSLSNMKPSRNAELGSILIV